MHRFWLILLILVLLAGTGAAEAKRSSDQPDAQASTCSDSDGGQKLYRWGQLVDVLGTTFEDTCVSTDTLKEYNCDSLGNATSSEQLYPNGCQDGACIGPNGIVIGWDGAQRDHLVDCINQKIPQSLTVIVQGK